MTPTHDGILAFEKHMLTYLGEDITKPLKETKESEKAVICYLKEQEEQCGPFRSRSSMIDLWSAKATDRVCTKSNHWKPIH